MRIKGCAVLANFKMEVWATRASCLAEFSNKLSTLDDVSWLDQVLIIVGIEGCPG